MTQTAPASSVIAAPAIDSPVTEALTAVAEHRAAVTAISDVDPTDFSGRHIGPDEVEAGVLLQTLGLPDLEALADAAIPGVLRRAGRGHELNLPPAATEAQALAELRVLA